MARLSWRQASVRGFAGYATGSASLRRSLADPTTLLPDEFMAQARFIKETGEDAWHVWYGGRCWGVTEQPESHGRHGCGKYTQAQRRKIVAKVHHNLVLWQVRKAAEGKADLPPSHVLDAYPDARRLWDQLAPQRQRAGVRFGV